MAQELEELLQAKTGELSKNYETKVNEIVENGQKYIDQINEEYEDPNAVEGTVNASFDVKWEMTSIKLDLPKIRMRREDLSFDVPELHTELEEIKFKVPATKIVEKCVTKVPKVIRVVPPKVEMVCLNVPVPEVYMKDVSIKIDLPKLRKKRIEIKFDIPEFHMERVEIKTKVLKIYMRDVEAQMGEKKKKIEDTAIRMNNELDRETQTFQKNMQEELVGTTNQYFDNQRTDIIGERKKVEEAYNVKISEYKKGITTLKENNAVEQVKTLEAELDSVVREYEQNLKPFDERINQVSLLQTQVLSYLKVTPTTA